MRLVDDEEHNAEIGDKVSRLEGVDLLGVVFLDTASGQMMGLVLGYAPQNLPMPIRGRHPIQGLKPGRSYQRGLP